MGLPKVDRMPTNEAALRSRAYQLLRHGAHGNVQTAIAPFVSGAPVARRHG
jgi:hypothetical protein